MTTIHTLNVELNHELDRYAGVPAIADGIRAGLGLEPGSTVGVEDCPVVAFLFLPSDELFRSFFVTPKRFCVFEMLANGDSLSVTVPLKRVTRVTETRAQGAVIITIELDGDIQRTTSSTEWIEADAAEGEIIEPGGRHGRAVSSSEMRPAFYELAEAADTEGARLVSEFARRLRNTLDQ